MLLPYKRLQSKEHSGLSIRLVVHYVLTLAIQPLINLYRRWFLSRLLSTAKLKYPAVFKGGARVQRISSNAVVKTGDARQIRCEVEAMRLVYTQTAIPIPRVHDVWEHDSKGFLVMDFIEGDNLKKAWHLLTTDQQNNLLNNLSRYVQELRAIPQPSHLVRRRACVGSADGGPLWDCAVSGVDEPYGPFENQKSFNDWRLTMYTSFGERHPPTAKHLASIREGMRPDDHPIVFTHGDIHRQNVIVNVRGEGPNDVEIAALLDWGQSGWRPQYWEGFKMSWLGSDKGNIWKEFGQRELANGYEACVDREIELLLVAGGIPPY